MLSHRAPYFFFFFNDTATTEIYTLSLHDALPICNFGQSSQTLGQSLGANVGNGGFQSLYQIGGPRSIQLRSEEHTSELQSRQYLVCRLLLEKKKIKSSSTCADGKQKVQDSGSLRH